MPTAIRDYGQQTASLLAYLIFKGVEGQLSTELEYKLNNCISALEDSGDRMTDLCVALRKQFKETPVNLTKVQKFVTKGLLVSDQISKIIVEAIGHHTANQKEGKHDHATKTA